LGDRLRMQRHTTDKGVFIRSLASRGNLGGLSTTTYDIVTVLDAMGKDVILVETVGAGQSEVDIARLADTNIVVTIPGMGDGLQAIKAGILESGDIFLVNKSDLPSAEMAAAELEAMLNMRSYTADAWKPPVVMTAPLHNKGINRLVGAIDRHRKYLGGDRLQRLRETQLRNRFTAMLQESLFRVVMTRLEREHRFEEILVSLQQGRTDLHSEVEMVLADMISDPADSGEMTRKK